jgi:hypothetical protein
LSSAPEPHAENPAAHLGHDMIALWRVKAAENTMDEMRILSPTGVCGSGFLEESFEKALAKKPHFIGCDGGSTDPGPSHLGSGQPAFPREATKRDLRIMLLGARRIDVPLLVGSAGTAGGDVHLDWFCDIVHEIAAEEGLSFKLAKIHAEQKQDYLKKRLREGRIKALQPAPEFNAGVIDRASCIVGMMGAEPYMRAIVNKLSAEVSASVNSPDIAQRSSTARRRTPSISTIATTHSEAIRRPRFCPRCSHLPATSIN